MNKKFLLLLGDFTFLDPQIDGEQKCIIHKIYSSSKFESEDEASEKGEELLDIFTSYLVLPTYGGEIEFNYKLSKKEKKTFSEFLKQKL